MIKKRRFLYLLLVFMLSIGMLTGCHGSHERHVFQMPEEFDTSEEYTITFWAKNDTNVTQTRIYEKAIEDFQKLYPNITVNLRLYTNYNRIYNDVITNMATDTTPNVCITYPDHIATYLTGNNSVVPLNDLFVNEKYGLGGSEVRFDSPAKEEIIPQFLKECALGDYYYALPYMRSTEACYVNKTYVEKLGYTLPEVLTWDYIWEVSEAALKKNEDGTYALNGQKVLIPFIYKSTDNMMIQMLKQLDAGYSTGAGKIRIFNDTTKDLLYTVSEHVKSGAFSTFKISSYPADFLNAGQCIFAIDSTAGATWMGSDAPLLDISEEQIVEFETEVMMLPQFDTENPQMISQGPSVCIFNKEDPQEVLASWLFTQYLLSNEVQNAYAATEGYVPVTSKAQNSAEYQDYLSRAGEDTERYYEVKIDASKLLLEHVEDTFVTPVFNGSASLRNAAGQMIEEVAKSTRRKQEIDEAYMESLFSDMISGFHLNVYGADDALSGKAQLGELPGTAKLLLGGIAVTWIGILFYVIYGIIRRKKEK